jgi:hypothetical protein
VSTYLQLAVDLRRECGIAGTGPTGVTNQTGELARVVEWVAQSYTEIQNSKPNWRWLRSEFTLPTVASDDDYIYSDCTDTIDTATITRFRRWYPHEFRIYLTSAGVGTERWLNYQAWDAFRRSYKIATQNAGSPSVVTIDPRNHIRLGPKPDAIYTVTGDYQKSAQILAADADVPEMPEDYHMLIVSYAMWKYASNVAAPEVWTHAKTEARRMYNDLVRDQAPEPCFAPPLA